ncbi:PatB family C-S lyase [Lactobacillus sp. ESL0791]|uniref:MalY/PatB family protein n=1 Tax=Lactobacillus sp. ESL0791 TaxID=2983234 RepID=UPI0023F61EBC|nr:PatB family C-S lyase [Lactobacillus sp. ESL0791]MDF7639409.1 PatB family C-S lyase [Lactobacillus sp. ESL0791]
MNYDFTTIVSRRNTNSAKWDVGKNELPMSLADMDFRAAPEIVTAMQAKVNLGVFGYENIPEDYYQAVINWYQTQHHAQIKREWLLYANGVIPALSSLVRWATNIGDNILVQAPVYDIFFHSIENNGRHTLSSDLAYDGNSYRIDWHDLEEKLAEPLTTMMILCNPHNPVGKVWTRDELRKILNLCTTYHVKLVSDEIHGDLAWGKTIYTPLFSLVKSGNEQIVTLVSPSKAFNVAALHAATVIVPDENLRNQINRGLNNDELAEPNILSVPGTIAAYRDGKDWIAALQQQLKANWLLAVNFIKDNIPELKISSGRATYLMWLDVSHWTQNSAELAEIIRAKTGLILAPGTVYRGNGKYFLRLNYACPSQMLLDGLNRLKQVLNPDKL